MSRARPGWLVAVCALVVAVSAWLPWLRSSAGGGGRANGIGGVAGAMPVPPPNFGVGQLIVLLAATLVVTLIIVRFLALLEYGWVVEALLAVPFLAQKQLGEMVKAVADALDVSLEAGARR